MDRVIQKEALTRFLRKYRYVALVLLLGVVLMALPQTSEEETAQPQPVQTETSLQDALGNILSKVEGAGKVEVLLTQSSGEEILYQTDDDQTISDNSRDRRSQTVLVENSDRQKTGLVRQVNPPSYQGAIILAQGADSAVVRLSLMEAVMGATGLPSHCITILKMK